MTMRLRAAVALWGLGTIAQTDEYKRSGVQLRLPRVFIGSSSEARDIAHHLQVALDDSGACEAQVWDQGTFGASRYALDSLVEAAQSSDFAVLVATPDDNVTSRDVTSGSPRDNVLFELGLFMGALEVRRVFILSPEDPPVRLPSDLSGLTRLKSYRTRQDGRLISSLMPAVLQIRQAIDDLGPRATNAETERSTSFPSTAVGTRAPLAVRPIPRYGITQMFANSYPGHFRGANQNRPAVHLRAVWQPRPSVEPFDEFPDARGFEQMAPTHLLEQWHTFYARRGGVGSAQNAQLNASMSGATCLVVDQDCATSAGAEPQASARAAVALLDGAPALRFVADLSLGVPERLSLGAVLASLRNLAVHSSKTMPHWFAGKYEVDPEPDGVLELHAMGAGPLNAPGIRDSLETYVDLDALGPRGKSTPVAMQFAVSLEAAVPDALEQAVFDAVLKSRLNWGYLEAPADVRKNITGMFDAEVTRAASRKD